MFAIAVEWLMGRAVLTRSETRGEKSAEPEWPPHPDRVFMALTAAWGESDDPPDAAQQVALEWLESLDPPAIAFPTETSRRAAFVTYVPVNDDESPMGKKGPYGPMGSLPIGRNRQPRMFPAVVPESPRFDLVWQVDPPEPMRAALNDLCGRVTYLGHSSSPVRMWIADQPHKSPTLVPTETRATRRLRAFRKGRLRQLGRYYQAGLRPQPTAWQGYAEVAGNAAIDDAVQGPFDPALLMFRQVAGRRFGLESAGLIAAAIRDTLMQRFTKRYGTAPPEWLSGHAADGTPSRLQRLAYVPAANIENDHADGHLLGAALVVPREFSAEQFAVLDRLLRDHGENEAKVVAETAFLRLWFRDPQTKRTTGELHLELDDRPARQRQLALQPERWTRAVESRDVNDVPVWHWASFTPVELPRFPKKNELAEEIVARACVEAGYPEPHGVRLGPAPFARGVPHTRSFTTVAKPGLPSRPRLHVELTFARPIVGPLLIGAGRFRGAGVMVPVPKESRRAQA